MKKIIFIVVSVLVFNLLLIPQSISDNMETLLENHKGKEGISQIKKLLKKDDINAKDKNGWTALMFASYNGHTDIVKELIKLDADVNIQIDGNRNKDNTVLTTIAKHYIIGRLFGVVATGVIYFNKQTIETDANVVKGFTDLMLATINSHIEIVEILINNGADVNKQDANGVTALMYASILSNNDIMKTLISKGADVNKQDANGVTALMYACLTGDDDIVKRLILSKANVNKQTDDGATPLMFAAAFEHKKVMETLMKSGAYIHANNKIGVKELEKLSVNPTIEFSNDNNFDEEISEIKAGKPFYIKVDIDLGFIGDIRLEKLPTEMYAYFTIENTDKISINDIKSYSGKLVGTPSVINDKSIAYILPITLVPGTESRSAPNEFIFKIVPEKDTKKSEMIVRLIFDGELNSYSTKETIVIKENNIPFIPFF